MSEPVPLTAPVRHVINGGPTQRNHITALLAAEGVAYEQVTFVESLFLMDTFVFKCTPATAQRLREKGLRVCGDFDVEMVI